MITVTLDTAHGPQLYWLPGRSLEGVVCSGGGVPGGGILRGGLRARIAKAALPALTSTRIVTAKDELGIQRRNSRLQCAILVKVENTDRFTNDVSRGT